MWTFRVWNTAQGWLLIRTEPSGYELVWEVLGSKKEAHDRRRFWTHTELSR